MNKNWSFIKKGGLLLAVGLIVGALLAGCGGSGGGSGGGSATISATATTTAQNLTVGTAMTSFSPLVASGGVAPDVYSVVGTLPAGLSLNASTGNVTGTPTAVYPTASLVFSVKDANGVAASTTSTVDFSVGAASVTISAAANTTAQILTVGTAMTSFSPLTPSGGASPYTYSITSGTLPAGLTLSATTGAVTGTPTVAQPAASVVFSVADANGGVASTTSAVNFTINAALTTITAAATTTAQSLTVGTTMASFSPLTPSGGVSPYFFSNTGTLPAGLSLNSVTGAVTGTPTAAYNAASIVFSVKDNNGVTASTTSTVSFTVVAAGAPISATANTTPQSLTAGTAMASFSPLTASGGTVPYTYINMSGYLPAGLSFNVVTGAVTGTPTGAGVWSVSFSVRDANNNYATTTSTVSFTVAAAAPTYVVQGGLTWMPVGLMTYTWPQAATLCTGTINGLTGWRLPTQPELSNLFVSGAMNGHGWAIIPSVWSSTVYSLNNYYYVNLSNGMVGNGYYTGAFLAVACVR